MTLILQASGRVQSFQVFKMIFILVVLNSDVCTLYSKAAIKSIIELFFVLFFKARLYKAKLHWNWSSKKL